MNQFKSLPEYENFVYTLAQQYPYILHSTLIVTRHGRYIAELTGELAFPSGHRLVVYELLTWDIGPLIIEGYSYEVWESNDKGNRSRGIGVLEYWSNGICERIRTEGIRN